MNKKRSIFSIALLLLPLTGCNKQQDYEMKDYVLELEYKDNFKILQLSDIHIANKDDRERQFEFLDKTITRANANMIIVTGDLFTFGTKRIAKDLFNFFDSYKIPWTITLGNHDEQCYFSIDWLTGYLNDLSNSKDSYCIFKDIQDDNVFGNTNFAINLTKDNKIVEQLILMDSNRYHYGDYIGYDYFHEDQIEWYKNLIDYTTSINNNEVAHSLMFYHIPLPQWQDAIDGLKTGKTKLIAGEEYEENVACAKYDSGMFDAVLEKGSTDGMFVGHDHLNDCILQYEGLYLGYCVTSTDRIYFNEDLLGGTCITIKNDHSLEFELIIRDYEEYK